MLLLVWMAVGMLLAMASTTNRLSLESTFSSAAPCSGLYNSHGFQGCTSAKHEQKGKLMLFRTKEALLAHIFDDSTSILISTDLWCKLSHVELQSLPHTHITALTIIIIPANAEEQYSRCENKLQASLLFPVIRIQTREESQLLLEQTTAQQQPYYSTFPFYMGKANAMNSSVCLEMGKCDPLGGLSVWGVVHNPPLQRGEEMILLTANLDAKAFFHDLSFGFVQSAGDVAIALAVAKALSILPKTETRIGIALFQGEAMGRIGSKRFLQDVTTAQCLRFSSSKNETCLMPPNYMLEWTKFEGNVSRIKTVIALQRLLLPQSNLLVRGHGEMRNTLQTKLLRELNRTTTFVAATTTSGEEGVVPVDSTLRSFMENPTWSTSASVGGLSLSSVVSDNDDDYLGEDEMPQTIDLDRAQAVGTALARTLYSLATNATEEEQDVQVDRDYLEQVLLCFGARDGYLYANCTLALNLLNVTSAQMQRKLQSNGVTATNGFALNPLPAFTSIYRPSQVVTNNIKLREQLARNLLADACFARDDDEPAFLCKTDVNCRNGWMNATCQGLASNSSKICLAGRCVCSSVSYHDTYNTRLVFTVDNGRYIIAPHEEEDETLWTEPIWTSQQGFTTFAVSNVESVAVSLAVGITISLISLVLIRRAQRTEKFKLT